MKRALKHNWFTDSNGNVRVVRRDQVVSDNHPAVKQGGIFADVPSGDDSKPKKSAAKKATKSAAKKATK